MPILTLRPPDRPPAAPIPVRCGQVWGTGCRAWVTAPTWRHTNHGGGLAGRAWWSRCPAPVLQTLASHFDSNFVLEQVASHPNCRIDTLLRLVRGTDPVVHRALLRNARLGSGRVLNEWEAQTATSNPDLDVMRSLVRNPACPPAVLEQAAHHSDDQVRSYVAIHPSCSLEIRALLAGDPDVWVRSRAQALLPEEYRALAQVAQ